MKFVLRAAVAVFAAALFAPSAFAFNPDTLVNVGSPSSPFSQNKQNEPAVAIDANHPNVLAAGANDNIDMEACNAGDPTTCPFTPNVGGSGIYFSFDSGTTWTQPTYSGWTARHCLGPAPCQPAIGPIGTLPGYFESGLVSDGDPALAFGPRPGPDGSFSWANGSRLYYANLTSSVSADLGEPGFPRGFEAIGVSRTDDVAAAAAGDNDAWKRPVLVNRMSSTTFADKEQIWADNAESSDFFGNVYVCWAEFRSLSRGRAFAAPLTVATSRDGGDRWIVRQLGAAAVNIRHLGKSGCSIRTDSEGNAYVFAVEFAFGFPGFGWHVMSKSTNGGQTWSPLRRIFPAVDTCNAFDPVNGRCVQDGIAGARNDLGPAPSVDIANGAPTGADATDLIVDTWVDGRDGLNNEHVMFAYSTNGGSGWTQVGPVEEAGDRGYYSAPALSPDGEDLYLVYNAFLDPYRADTVSPRRLQGVVLHSDVGAGGAPTGFSTLHRGAAGDARASSQNNLVAEFLGDYVYAAATRDYGAAVWNDVRNGQDCPAIDTWRAALQAGAVVPPPAPEVDCPATFGNTDIFGGTYPDPTP